MTRNGRKLHWSCCITGWHQFFEEFFLKKHPYLLHLALSPDSHSWWQIYGSNEATFLLMPYSKLVGICLGGALAAFHNDYFSSFLVSNVPKLIIILPIRVKHSNEMKKYHSCHILVNKKVHINQWQQLRMKSGVCDICLCFGWYDSRGLLSNMMMSYQQT